MIICLTKEMRDNDYLCVCSVNLERVIKQAWGGCFAHVFVDVVDLFDDVILGQILKIYQIYLSTIGKGKEDFVPILNVIDRCLVQLDHGQFIYIICGLELFTKLFF